MLKGLRDKAIDEAIQNPKLQQAIKEVVQEAFEELDIEGSVSTAIENCDIGTAVEEGVSTALANCDIGGDVQDIVHDAITESVDVAVADLRSMMRDVNRVLKLLEVVRLVNNDDT